MSAHNKKAYATIFTALTALFFVPCSPPVAEFMEGLWKPAIAVYWLILSVIAIVLGFRALKGV